MVSAACLEAHGGLPKVPISPKYFAVAYNPPSNLAQCLVNYLILSTQTVGNRSRASEAERSVPAAPRTKPPPHHARAQQRSVSVQFVALIFIFIFK